MTTTTIGPFTVTHENGVLQAISKFPGPVFIVSAATEIERLRALEEKVKSSIGGYTAYTAGYIFDTLVERSNKIVDERDCLKSEIDDAKQEVKRLRSAMTITEGEMEERGTDIDTLKTALTASKDEIERLRSENNTLSIGVSTFNQAIKDHKELIGLSEDRTRTTITFEGAEHVLELLTSSMQILAAKAENYVECKLSNKAGASFVVTIQKDTGKTPHELRREAEAERDHLKSKLAAAVATMDGCIYSAHHRSAMNKRLASKPHAGNDKGVGK